MPPSPTATEEPITWDELIRRGLTGYGFRALSISVEFEQGLKQHSNFPSGDHDPQTAIDILRVLRESKTSLQSSEIAKALGYRTSKGRFHTDYLKPLVKSGRVFHNKELEAYADDPTKFLDGNSKDEN
jgi:hypothetical protein